MALWNSICLPYKLSNNLLQMSEDVLIYQFTLDYTPSPVGDAQIVRTTGATVSIECHYPRSDLNTT